MPYPYAPYVTPTQPVGQRRLAFVAGEQGASAYYVGPGEAVALFDMGDGGRMWVKSADQSGVCSKEEYRIEPVEPAPAPQYVSRADLEDFKREILEAMRDARTEPVREVRDAEPRHAAGAWRDASGDHAGGER